MYVTVQLTGETVLGSWPPAGCTGWVTRPALGAVSVLVVASRTEQKTPAGHEVIFTRTGETVRLRQTLLTTLITSHTLPAGGVKPVAGAALVDTLPTLHTIC